MLLTSKKWHTAAVFEKKDTDAVMDALLKGRNIVTPEQREKFMLDGDGLWHDPFLFADMDKAVDIIVESIRDNKKILVYGDYDCDGICATTIMAMILEKLKVSYGYYIPNRFIEGYGLNLERLQQAWHVTLPCIRATIITLFILQVGRIMNSGFEQIFYMQNASVKGVSEILDTYIYNITFKAVPSYGFSTAVGMFKSVINLVMLISANVVVRRLGGTGLMG